jgi:hypothetical protein
LIFREKLLLRKQFIYTKKGGGDLEVDPDWPKSLCKGLAQAALASLEHMEQAYMLSHLFKNQLNPSVNENNPLC